jgi:hypothetical protein
MVVVSVKDVIRQEFDELCLEDKLSCPGLTKVLFNDKIVNKKICKKRKLSCSSDHKVKKPRKPKRRKRGG